MAELTEKTLHSEQILDGRLLKVYRDDVVVPGGGTSYREWIDHPGAAAVIPLMADGSTVLVRQFRYPPREVFLEIPAGKFDREGEDPAALARRELEEETGWRASRWTSLGAFCPCIGYSNEQIHFFLAEGLTPGTQHLDAGETVEVVRMPFREAVAAARRGALRDLKTVSGLLLAEAFLNQRS